MTRPTATPAVNTRMTVKTTRETLRMLPPNRRRNWPDPL
jgi:hypothetical protein